MTYCRTSFNCATVWTKPVTAAIEALSDPQREIRLAATMALVEHPDRTKAVTPLREAEATTRMPTSVRKAEWAMAVASRAEALGDRARTALASGDLRLANQILSMMTDSRSGYLAALKFG